MPARSVDRKEAPGRGRNANSLIVESLEIGRALADHGRATFRAHGTCMYPCVQPGDKLLIESRLIAQVEVGDIAVIRRGESLFGHRAIAKGLDTAGAYIVTRPDRSKRGDDGPTYGENILGVVTGIDRRGKKVPTAPMPLRGFEKSKVWLWEWWHWNCRPRLSHGLEPIRRRRLYKAIASTGMKATHPKRLYKVRVPLKPGQSHDLCREFSPLQFDVTKPVQQGKPVMEWDLDLSFGPKRPVAASITLSRNPEEYSRKPIWHIANSWVQNRYRGAGLEDVLAQKAREILARGGAVLREDRE